MFHRHATALLLWMILRTGYEPSEKVTNKIPAAGTQEKTAITLGRLSPELRRRIDGAADRTPPETLPQRRIDFAGKPVAWAISRVNLTAGEEHREATVAHQIILLQLDAKKTKIIQTAEGTNKLFQRLRGALPPHLNPPEFEWTLKIIDSPECNAFTIGGGYVYLFRGLLNALKDDPNRGEDALAFVLAHEMGHVALGHCRRGYELLRIEKEVQEKIKSENEFIREFLQTMVNPAGSLVKFSYTREQEYAADLFALHLCRNAGMDLDSCLDLMRFFVALGHPDLFKDPEYLPTVEKDRGILEYYFTSHPNSLHRLRRLRIELSGVVEDESRFGLFVRDPQSGNLTRANNNQFGAGERALVLVHGMGGDLNTFGGLLKSIGPIQIPILEMRYPHNGSLAYAAAMLKREMERVMRSPERAVLVGHSAGGLVIRAYAEKLDGRFGQAVFLATPHKGSDLVSLKILLDLALFAPRVWPSHFEPVAGTIREGHGQIGLDLHPDSLFLRWLKGPPDPAHGKRYSVYAADCLNKLEKITLDKLFPSIRLAAKKYFESKLDPGWIRDRILDEIDRLRLPDELLHGDGVVTIGSATAVGSPPKICKGKNHSSIKTDDDVVNEILDLIQR